MHGNAALSNDELVGWYVFLPHCYWSCKKSLLHHNESLILFWEPFKSVTFFEGPLKTKCRSRCGKIMIFISGTARCVGRQDNMWSLHLEFVQGRWTSPPHPKPMLCEASTMCNSANEVHYDVASTMCASSRNVNIPTPPHPTPTLPCPKTCKTLPRFSGCRQTLAAKYCISTMFNVSSIIIYSFTLHMHLYIYIYLFTYI